jgi:site-specific recombinase XerD
MEDRTTEIADEESTADPLPLARARELYLESRRGGLSDRTIEAYGEQLAGVIGWLEARGDGTTEALTARAVEEYRADVAAGKARTTLSVELSTVRRFVGYCESLGAVEPGTADRIDLPARSRDARNEALGADEAGRILSHLRRYHPGSRTHALMALLWHTGMRTGTARALDLRDLDRERDRLRVRHRPGTGTPLKNGERAERFVTLSPDVAGVLRDYVDGPRRDATDEHGRRPLLTTRNGRPAKNTIRRVVYAATRPCATGRDCPHGEDPRDCGAARRTNEASKCPSTLSPHPVRRGAITHFLRSDVPEEAVSDRMDVSRDVLGEHYDVRTEEERAEQRRAFLDNV